MPIASGGHTIHVQTPRLPEREPLYRRKTHAHRLNMAQVKVAIARAQAEDQLRVLLCREVVRGSNGRIIKNALPLIHKNTLDDLRQKAGRRSFSEILNGL